jgi:hypothetical protein
MPAAPHSRGGTKTTASRQRLTREAERNNNNNNNTHNINKKSNETLLQPMLHTSSAS